MAVPGTAGRAVTPGVIIVCHAAPAWGFGHLHRSLAMAAVARELEWEVHLVTRGPKDQIDSRLPPLLATFSIPQNATLASEFECLKRALDALRAKGAERLRLVVDHPHLDVSYAEGIAELGIRWLTITQSANPPGPPNWVVSPLTAREQGFDGEETHAHWLRGPDFSVLRPIFRKGCPQPYRPLSERQRLLVTFGGGRDFGATERLLPPILEAFPTLEVQVVTTRSNDSLPRIETLAGQYEGRLRLTLEPNEITDHMCEAGAAVTAGGTTTVELAALGLPFITVAIAGNQEAPSRAWEDRGVSLHAGNLESDALVDNVLAHLRQLSSNPHECIEKSRRAQECVDGLGAQRILSHLLEDV